MGIHKSRVIFGIFVGWHFLERHIALAVVIFSKHEHCVIVEQQCGVLATEHDLQHLACAQLGHIALAVVILADDDHMPVFLE